MPYMEKSTFTEYEFAFLLLHSANSIFECETGIKFDRSL